MYFVKSKNLKGYKHGFFSKLGGVSKGIYSSLNCGYSSFDKKENIDMNRKIIAKKLDFKISDLIIPNQYHSNKIFFSDNKSKEFKCDGIINFLPKIVIGVLSADCCPILVGHKKNLFTACIHIGWKGLYKQIVENFISKIENLNINKEDILVAIGPSIGFKSYQVSEEFRENFIKKDISSSVFFNYNKTKDKLYFNIKGLIYKKFYVNNIKNIWISKLDTYIHNEKFFSYRYSSHNGKVDYGRMLSVIVKK